MLTVQTEAFLRDIVEACRKHGCELEGVINVHVIEECFYDETGPSSLFELSTIDDEGAFSSSDEKLL
jgi:hypothetical protein